MNSIMNTSPNANAHVADNILGISRTLARNPMMLIANKLALSGAIFAIVLFL